MVEPVKIDVATEIRNLISGCRFACRVPSISIMLILSSPENHMLTTTTTPGTDQPAQAEVSLTPTDLVSAAGSGTNECLQPVRIESHQNDSPDPAPLPCNEFYDVISLPQRQNRATRKRVKMTSYNLTSNEHVEFVSQRKVPPKKPAAKGKKKPNLQKKTEKVSNKGRSKPKTTQPKKMWKIESTEEKRTEDKFR